MTDPSRPSRPLIDIVLDHLENGEHPVVIYTTNRRGTDLEFDELADGK